MEFKVTPKLFFLLLVMLFLANTQVESDTGLTFEDYPSEEEDYSDADDIKIYDTDDEDLD